MWTVEVSRMSAQWVGDTLCARVPMLCNCSYTSHGGQKYSCALQPNDDCATPSSRVVCDTKQPRADCCFIWITSFCNNFHTRDLWNKNTAWWRKTNWNIWCGYLLYLLNRKLTSTEGSSGFVCFLYLFEFLAFLEQNVPSRPATHPLLWVLDFTFIKTSFSPSLHALKTSSNEIVF